MGGLFGGKTISTKAQQIAGVQIQTSAYGLVIPVGYGQNRLPANIIYFNDWTAIPHTTTSGGGKGGSPKMKNTTYTYTGTLMLAIQAGPITAYGRQFADKDTIATAAWATWQRNLGAYGQAAWAFLTGAHPADADPYSGVAYVAKSAYDMGDTGQIKNNSFETIGFLPVNNGVNNNASPPAIVNHMLTDQYEGLGYPSAQLGDMTSAGDFYKYTAAQGLLFSPAYTEQTSARDLLKDLVDAANCEFVWSGGILKVIPYADANVSGSSTGTLVNYTANVTPVYDLTDNDYIKSGAEDPVRVFRTKPADAWNVIQIEFLDKALDYNTNVIEAKDQANIEAFGERPSDVLKMHFITDMATAQLVAQIILQKRCYIRNSYEFTVGWRYALLEPMDLVTLTDSNLGMVQKTVRIANISENDRGELTIKAMEWPFGTATPALFSTQAGTGYAPNTQADPGNANTPVIFEPPLSLTNGEQQIWLGTSGGADWGGADVWVTVDAGGANYQQLGTIYAGCRHGVVDTAGYTAGATSVLINLAASLGTVGNANATSQSASIPLWYIDGEIMSYTGATLTSANHYTLTGCGLGLYGIPNATHVAGTKVMRLDEGVAKLVTPQGSIGKTLYIKLVSFNKTGNALQDISTLTPFTYVVVGGLSGAASIRPPTGVTIACTAVKP